jgi:5-methylcytosine-specific restriction enzyme subunit McrC
MLLYAKTDETIFPNNEYLMSGNKVSVKTLYLNNNFSIIQYQLDIIVDEWLEKTS